jgi:hypothetical protein
LLIKENDFDNHFFGIAARRTRRRYWGDRAHREQAGVVLLGLIPPPRASE